MTDSQQFLSLLECLKKAGINDPNIDLFYGVVTNNEELVKTSLKNNADVNLTDRQLIGRYRLLLQSNCHAALREFESS